MEGADAEAVLLQRFIDDGDFALAVAEDERVLKVLGVAQRRRRISRFSCTSRPAGTWNCDAPTAVVAGFETSIRADCAGGFGDAADFRRHRRGEEQSAA